MLLPTFNKNGLALNKVVSGNITTQYKGIKKNAVNVTATINYYQEDHPFNTQWEIGWHTTDEALEFKTELGDESLYTKLLNNEIYYVDTTHMEDEVPYGVLFRIGIQKSLSSSGTVQWRLAYTTGTNVTTVTDGYVAADSDFGGFSIGTYSGQSSGRETYFLWHSDTEGDIILRITLSSAENITVTGYQNAYIARNITVKTDNSSDEQKELADLINSYTIYQDIYPDG